MVSALRSPMRPVRNGKLQSHLTHIKLCSVGEVDIWLRRPWCLYSRKTWPKLALLVLWKPEDEVTHRIDIFFSNFVDIRHAFLRLGGWYGTPRAANTSCSVRQGITKPLLILTLGSSFFRCTPIEMYLCRKWNKRVAKTTTFRPDWESSERGAQAAAWNDWIYLILQSRAKPAETRAVAQWWSQLACQSEVGMISKRIPMGTPGQFHHAHILTKRRALLKLASCIITQLIGLLDDPLQNCCSQ